MSIYVMPNGRKYKFQDGEVPAGAVKVVKKPKPAPVKEPAKPKKKAAETPKNKAKKPANKSRKAATKNESTD